MILVPRRLFLLLGVTLLCFCDHAGRRLFRSAPDSPPAKPLQQWCTSILRCIGVIVEVEGAVPATGLIVSNHLSYLDILVYSSISGGRFVAKSDVRSWPLFGWIATLAGTIYVNRRRPGETNSAARELEQALSGKHLVVLFPEGTSSDGGRVLPFHSSLFEAAVASRTPIKSAGVSYEVSNGSVAQDVCYWGDMVLARHILRLLAIREVRAKVRFSADARIFDDRKRAAQSSHAEVAALFNGAPKICPTSITRAASAASAPPIPGV